MRAVTRHHQRIRHVLLPDCAAYISLLCQCLRRTAAGLTCHPSRPPPRRQLAGALSTADKDMDRLRVEVRGLQQQVRSAETLLMQERTSNDELTAQKDSLRSKLGSAQEQLKQSVLMMQ